MKINFLNSNLMKTSKFFIGAMFCLTLVTSCSDDDDTPAPVLEEEQITNVNLMFTNDADPMDVVLLTDFAPDGQNGASTSTITGNFTAGETYSLSIAILNSEEDPNNPEDVLNDDIIPEADEHFFSYAVSGLNLTMMRDSDDIEGPDGSNLGVNTTWVAGMASSGNLQIILTHEPTSVDDSDEFGAATGGSQDFNIVFENINIQ